MYGCRDVRRRRTRCVRKARTDGMWAVKESAALFGTETVFDGVNAPDGV